MVSVLASSVVERGFIDGVMFSVLASSVVERGFEARSGQTKYFKIDICCFSGKHTLLKRKKQTDWLGIMIKCPSGATYLPEDCCFNDLAL